MGGRDVPSAPGEPGRHLHLGPLGTACLEDRDEREPLGVDRAAAADPDRGRRDLSGDPRELEAPFRRQAPAAGRTEDGEPDQAAGIP